MRWYGYRIGSYVLFYNIVVKRKIQLTLEASFIRGWRSLCLEDYIFTGFDSSPKWQHTKDGCPL